MRIKLFWLVCIVILPVTVLFPEVKNPDKPAKGEWDFKLKEVLRVEKAGDELLTRPLHLLVSDDGMMYLYDYKTEKLYLFTKEGKLMKSIAQRGEGDGELKWFYNGFLVNDKLVIVDAYELEYFTKDGTFIRKVANDFSIRLPNHFVNEDEFVYFPLLKYADPNLKGKIFLYNIKTGKEKVMADFQIYEGGVAKSEEVVMGVLVPGLTPILVFHYEPDRIYYGRNDSYKIIAADHNGKELDSFSVARKKGKATPEEIKSFFHGRPIPPEALPKMIRSVPDDFTYFCRIETQNKLLYVYDSNLDRELKSQQVDIFSPGGIYLYRSVIHPPEGFKIASAWSPLVIIKGNHLYMALRSDDGKSAAIVKYEVTLPVPGNQKL